jgi:hypothetical protein
MKYARSTSYIVDPEFLDNTHRVFNRLRELGLAEVEYVGHLVSATGTSFTPEKRMKVLDFPQPTTQKEMLQFIGLASYFRDYVPNYQRTSKLIWTAAGSAAFKLCHQAISNCYELYFLEGTATPILQTDASDYGIGIHMITDRTITQFIRQCQCCQVMSRLKILIKTHPFTCTSYNPFGPLSIDSKGNTHILVMIDAFSRWVELFLTKTTGDSEHPTVA